MKKLIIGIVATLLFGGCETIDPSITRAFTDVAVRAGEHWIDDQFDTPARVYQRRTVYPAIDETVERGY